MKKTPGQTSSNLGEAILLELGFSGGPKAARSEVAGLWHLWQEHSDDFGVAVFAALEALIWIRAGAEAVEGASLVPDKSTQIEVPWWVVKVLSQAWLTYRKSAENQSVGQAFELEGKERGGRPKAAQLDRLQRDLRITLEVVARTERAKAAGKRVAVDAAVAEVAGSFALGKETVWAAYKRHQKQVRARYERYAASVR